MALMLAMAPKRSASSKAQDKKKAQKDLETKKSAQNDLEPQKGKEAKEAVLEEHMNVKDLKQFSSYCNYHGEHSKDEAKRKLCNDAMALYKEADSDTAKKQRILQKFNADRSLKWVSSLSAESENKDTIKSGVQTGWCSKSSSYLCYE